MPEELRIESAQRRFRILVLNGSRHRGRFGLSLIVANIPTSWLYWEDPMPRSDGYTAISYAWEDAGPKRLVPCFEVSEDRPTNVEFEPRIKISDTLFDMLENFKNKEGCRMLWVDAVCINQHNAEERAE